MNLIKSKSSLIALFFNVQLAHIINPWVLTVDYENETITVEKRNWYFSLVICSVRRHFDHEPEVSLRSEFGEHGESHRTLRRV